MAELKSETSQNAKTLSGQLKKLVGNAERIQTEFSQSKSKLSPKLLWLRPSVDSISLVSCNIETPQKGYSKIHSVRDLDQKLKQTLKKPGRPTPEKKLQSWLIREALEHKGRVKPLEEVLGGGCEYWFVSDEIAIKVNSSRKVVADLLLVKVDTKGVAQLVNVELKYQRAMEAFKQVRLFRDVLELPELQELWRQFAEKMTGKQFQWEQSRDTHGIVVWPKSEDPARALANDKTQNYKRVDLVGFQECFTLKREQIASLRSSPDSSRVWKLASPSG